jgi:myo-inositol-1-phosphate synthase
MFDLCGFFFLPQKSNYFGSLTQASTSSLGIGPDGKDVYIPFKDLLPMLEPDDIEFDGIWTKNLS